jgi:hypothetical protein
LLATNQWFVVHIPRRTIRFIPIIYKVFGLAVVLQTPHEDGGHMLNNADTVAAIIRATNTIISDWDFLLEDEST